MNIEKQIEFDKIKALWMNLAMTQRAKEQISQTSFFLSERELRKQLKDTTDARAMIEQAGTPPLQDVTMIQEILLAAAKGECLTPYQLERVENILVLIRRLKSYLQRAKMYENPLAYYEENLYEAEELREEIARQIRNGQVDDHASKELAKIRSQIVRCEEQMKLKAEQVMRSQKECMADQYCTFRNGRVCVPVKKDCRSKISGSVIDKSSTGSTFFIEPAGAAKYNEQLQLLRIEEENEVYRILYALTAMAASLSEAFDQNLALIEKLDFIFSKGKLSIDLGASEPLINTQRRIVLREARHPLMDREINVPLQFEMGERARGIIITGPNTGGKTVAIKTVMLNCMMAQCGLHVTCKEADICMNSSYLCDIGDGQDLTENLSTFSAHIKNVLKVLHEVNRDSFVIMDELGSGTDPAEGMGIAIAILEELKKSGANFLVTTHYPQVKEYADKEQDIVNARMTFDKETLSPTYQMVIGEAGESCAFYIADRLGMPGHMLQTAIRAAYGKKALSGSRFQYETASSDRKKGMENQPHHASDQAAHKIIKQKNIKKTGNLSEKFKRGDSVMVYPDHKIGIVCEPVNEKGVLRIQLSDKKIWINHKRVKLHVAADRLYPEDYDFSIIFESASDRKIRHDMGRKYTDEVIRY
ncbi:MAG: DNA mismatch repair protein MutS [Eubacterium sp.]|nr:DNA mismatch repair protein MutS [Eubacterium sp.]